MVSWTGVGEAGGRNQVDPRICFVALGPSAAKGAGGLWKYGGAERLVVILANWLAAQGRHVSLIGIERAYWLDAGLDPSVPIIVPYRADSGLPGLRSFHPRFTGTWGAMARANADVYVQSGAGYLTGIVGLYRRFNNRKMLFMVTSDTNVDPDRVKRHFKVAGRDRFAYSHGLRQADRVVVQTKWQQDMLGHHYHRGSVVIPQGLDLSPFLSIDRRTDEDGGSVLWIGRASKLKRPDLLLELARRHRKVPFIILMGPGDEPGYHDQIRRAASELPNVEFFQSGTVDIVRMFARSALLVNTSETEGFPNTFIEAWASAMPVVTLACDPDEVICREGLGLHSRTLDQLSRDMVGLLADPPQRRAVGERARAFARTSHDIRSVGPRYVELFRDLFELTSGTYPSDEANSMAKS
jgi:glycosyltransferase involved in cell wall biosynthesis